MSDQRLQIKQQYPCLHRRQQIDAEARKVFCSECRAEIDPFDLLVQRARQGGYDDMLKRDIKTAREQLTKLQAEEKRIKARTKNASRKDADAAVRAERARLAEAVARARYAAHEIGELAAKIQRSLPERAADG